MGEIINFNSRKRKIKGDKPIHLYIILAVLVAAIAVCGIQVNLNIPVTYVLIGINALIFALIHFHKLYIERLGNSYCCTIQDKQTYRVVTAAFTHEEPLHILMNMYSLYSMGNVLEPYFGSFRFLIMYVIIMLLEGYLSARIHEKHSPNALCIGASGVLCGLLGVYMVVIFTYMGFNGLKGMIPSLLCLILMTTSKRIDSIGHFVGLGVGIVYGFILFMF